MVASVLAHTHCNYDGSHFNYDASQRAGFAISTIASPHAALQTEQ